MRILEKNILAQHHNKGWAWLENLPEFLKSIESQLSIQLDKPFKNLSFNYTAPATTPNGKSVVLKCGIPNKDLNTEIAALKHYNAESAIQLIKANEQEGWLLLERCEPGAPLSTIKNDREAMTIAAHVMQPLWKPLDTDYPFPSIDDWLKKLKPTKSIPHQLTDAAIEISKDLLASQGVPILLHGDLHHDNILSSQRESWLAIDPKGVVGEREYEVGALMRNPLNTPITQKMIQDRLDIFCEYLSFDRQRLMHWSFIQAVLAAIWCVEDNTEGKEHFIHLSESFWNSLR